MSVPVCVFANVSVLVLYVQQQSFVHTHALHESKYTFCMKHMKVLVLSAFTQNVCVRKYQCTCFHEKRVCARTRTHAHSHTNSLTDFYTRKHEREQQKKRGRERQRDAPNIAALRESERERARARASERERVRER